MDNQDRNEDAPVSGGVSGSPSLGDGFDARPTPGSSDPQYQPIASGQRSDKRDDGEPLVTEALASTSQAEPPTGSGDAEAELRALRHDVARLRKAVGEVAAGARSVVGTEIRGRLRDQPLTAVACAALLGYVFGLTR